VSEDWPDGWYRDIAPRQPSEGGGAGSADAQRAQPGYTPSGADAWAYGATQAVPGGSGAGTGPGAGGSAWPAQPAPVSGFPTVRGRVRGGRRWLRPRRILAILAALVMAVVLAGVAFYFDLNSKLSRVSVLVPTSLTSAGTNWLIAGSTGKLTRHQIVQLHTGYDYDTLSDTIMLLHLPANGGRPVLVSIPRDSYVLIPGHGYNKINAAYAFGGARLLVQTVQDVTGLRIDHYMAIGYTGLVSVVNDIGGVRVCLPGPIKDSNAGLNLKAGCQTLNGKQALGFVRSRAFANGDLQRVQDQRVLMKALLSKMTSVGTLINPFAVVPAASGAASAVTVDNGTGLSQLVSVAFALRNPITTTVPFGGFATTGVGSVVLWNSAEAKVFFGDLASDRTLPQNLITGSSVKASA
jgi:LCP family protein required for cell wall assembly